MLRINYVHAMRRNASCLPNCLKIMLFLKLIYMTDVTCTHNVLNLIINYPQIMTKQNNPILIWWICYISLYHSYLRSLSKASQYDQKQLIIFLDPHPSMKNKHIAYKHEKQVDWDLHLKSPLMNKKEKKNREKTCWVQTKGQHQRPELIACTMELKKTFLWNSSCEINISKGENSTPPWRPSEELSFHRFWQFP